MATDHKQSSTTEFIKVASGEKHNVTIDIQIFRKVTFENIKILDDSDYFSHGDFIFHLLIDKKSIGRSKVIYANTGEILPYKWSMAVKHSNSEPLSIEFRVDELESPTSNTEILRLSESYNQSSEFGIGDSSLKKYTYENKFLSVNYSIQKLSQDEFQKLTFIDGSVKSEDDLKPIKGAMVRVINLSDDKLVKKIESDSQGKFKIEGLNVEEKYQLKISYSGYVSFSHMIEDFPFTIDAVMPKLFIKGKVINEGDNSSIKEARVDLYKSLVKIPEDIKCFSKPDTKSDKLGTLEKGDYPMLEFKESGDTDYIRIKTDKFENDQVWICSRWQKNYYAFPFDKKEKEEITKTSAIGEFRIDIKEEQLYRLRVVANGFFDGESKRLLPIGSDIIKITPAEKAIPESALVNRLSDFKNFSYHLDNAYYPYDLPDINITKGNTNNCCTFAEGLVVKAWKDSLASDFSWSLDKHNKMMITSTTDYYSPITAVVESRMGVEIDKDKLPPPWTIVQGWKTQWTGGHSFLIVDAHQETQRILTLESNKSYKMDGPGFRQLGNIDDFTDCNPGVDWWKDSDLWDWAKFKETYPFRKMARLKVYDLKWVK